MCVACVCTLIMLRTRLAILGPTYSIRSITASRIVLYSVMHCKKFEQSSVFRPRRSAHMHAAKTHAHTQTDTHERTYVHKHTKHTHAQIRTKYTSTYTHKHPQSIHQHTHTNTHKVFININTHTHTQTHTHTHITPGSLLSAARVRGTCDWCS
jgi:hypothetical protein